MAENYTVNYNINVNSQKATEALAAFQGATAQLITAQKGLDTFQKTLNKTITTFSKLSTNPPKVRFNTEVANKQLNRIITKLNKIHELAGAIPVNTTGSGKSGKSGSTTRVVSTGGKSTTNNKTAPIGGSRKNTSVTSSTTITTPTGGVVTTPRATASSTRYVSGSRGKAFNPYKGASLQKILGETNLQYNGGMAIDMLKGMGIMYGLSGIGQAISGIVNQAAEYDNLMKTVENITKSHDIDNNFSGRFAAMARTVRDVGMETKFTVVEVASAAKFLAMAGLDLEAINKSIRPIADIALVGDTDLGETADLVTNVMTAYEKKPEEMRNVADIMTNTFTMTNTTLMDIAEAYKYSASLLNAADVGFEEATAAIGILGDAGIKGSQAGTTLRTIVANILNPTKKQSKAWAKYGISTTDKNGKRKSLLEIFQELNSKNLDAGAYFQLFHKTAATGAAALTSHVDKWGDVKHENDISGGLSGQLADAKKNTLKGLWAQVESVFMDTGVTAFQGIEGNLRAFMTDAIVWLKSDEAKTAFRDIASTMIEFVEMLVDVTNKFWDFFKFFGPAIKAWMKFQLVIWPVVKALSAFSAILNTIKGIGALSRGIAGLTGNMLSLARAAKSTTAVTGTGSLLGIPIGGGGKSAAGYTKWYASIQATQQRLHELDATYKARMATKDQLGAGFVLNTIDKDKRHLARLQAGYKRAVKAHVGNLALNVGGAAAGAGLMGLGMYQATQENANGWDLSSGALFGVAGMAAMAGGPFGWGIAAIAAVGGGIASLAANYRRLRETIDAVNQTIANSKLEDGIWSDSNSKVMKMLEFVWRKNYDINELLERRIELYRTQYGIETPETTTTNDVGNPIYKKFWDILTATDHWYDSTSMANAAVKLFNGYGQQFGYHIEASKEQATLGTQFMVLPDGTKIPYQNANGDRHQALAYDVMAAMELLKGDYRTKIIEENQKRLDALLYGKATAADVQAWQALFEQRYNPQYMQGLIKPNEMDVSEEQAKNWTGEEISKSYVGQALLWASLEKVRQAQQAVIDFKEKIESGHYNENDIVTALRQGSFGGVGTTLAEYNPNNVAGWFASLGYKDGTWHSLNGAAPEVVAQGAVESMRELLKAVDKLGLSTDPATENLRNYANLIISLGESFFNSGQELVGSKNGETKVVNGQTWRWNAMTRMWELVTDDGQLNNISQGIYNFSASIQNLQNVLSTPLWTSYSGYIPGGPVVYDSQNFGSGSGSGSGSGNAISDAASLIANGTGSPLVYSPQPIKNDWLFPKQKPLGPYLSSSSVTTMTPQQMGNAVAGGGGKKTGGTGGNGSTTGGNKTNKTGGSGGAKASDYQSHYKNNAAPKQVIVRIGNLMNVEAIDLSNPDNAATIANLKGQLAQALVDVVHDFDETWHG